MKFRGILFYVYFLLGIPAIGSSQQLLSTSYTFLGRAGKMTRLQQNNDTLFVQTCNRQMDCTNKFAQRFRILAVRQQGESHILQVESLDSISLTPDPYPLTRFSLIVLHKLSTQQVGYYVASRNLTRQQVAEIRLREDDLKDKFYLTFLSDNYLNQLKRLPSLTTSVDADRIKTELQQPEYSRLIKAWQVSDTQDLYATVLAAEMMNRVCIKLGLNPWLADESLQNIVRKGAKR